MPKPLFSKLIAQAAIGFFCVLFGCIYGIQTNDKIFLILSLLIGICCILRTVSLYRIIRSKAYQVFEGTCTKREPAFLKQTQQILLTDYNQQEYRFSFDKSVKLLQGHHYRLYFWCAPHGKDTIQSSQDLLGYEELSSISQDKNSDFH